MASELVALVTGASSGIGRACAGRLATQGFRVCGTSRRPGFQPTSFEPIVMDVTDGASVTRGVANLIERYGRIDCVINAAGYGLGGSIEDTSIEEAQRQFEANLFGVLRVCQAVLPVMRRQRSGIIVNISSLGGLFGLPFQGLYSASKFALEGLTESLRLETRPFGIRVVLIEPGDVRTAITRNRVLTAASRDGSAYRDTFRRVLDVIEKEESAGIAASDVAALVARVVRTGRPRLRYTVGHPGQRLTALLKRTLPWSICERLLLSFYGAGRPPGRGAQDPRRSDPASSVNR
jgi:NAD(P)-dependent dehydrogenase (short-subunit alcohol dehydrogenase family)